MSTIGSTPTDERWEVRPLDATTWDDFAELVERNGGVFGGCWCMGHHATAEGISHHQVPGIDKRAAKVEPRTLPVWRIPCFSTDTRHRREGIARAGLAGALDLIAADGGGVVESTPEIVGGRAAHGRFLFQASVELFEEHGFERIRQLGKWAWLVRRTVPAAAKG
ncbi:hypothetical protein GCM10028787_18070 [Brachybacterium horti]